MKRPTPAANFQGRPKFNFVRKHLKWGEKIYPKGGVDKGRPVRWKGGCRINVLCVSELSIIEIYSGIPAGSATSRDTLGTH